MPEVRVRSPGAARRAGAVVGVVGRHPDVERSTRSGAVCVDRLDHLGASPAAATTSCPASPSSRASPRGRGRSPRRSRRARQHRLHRRCRAPGRCGRRASRRRAHPVAPARRARSPARATAPPQPSSRTLTRSGPVARRTDIAMRLGAGVLDRVGHRLAGDVVRGGADVVGQVSACRSSSHRHAEVLGEVGAAPRPARRRGCSAAARARSGAARRRPCRARRRPGRAPR